MSVRRKRPSYLHHKAQGTAKTIVDGRTIYLGKLGSPESRDRYDRIIEVWELRRSGLPPGTVPVLKLGGLTLVILFRLQRDSHYQRR